MDGEPSFSMMLQSLTSLKHHTKEMQTRRSRLQSYTQKVVCDDRMFMDVLIVGS